MSVSLNGMLAGEAQFAGKPPYRMSLSVPPSLLREGQNELSLTNVAERECRRCVFLDRFTLSYPQVSSFASGVFEAAGARAGRLGLGCGGACRAAGRDAPAPLAGCAAIRPRGAAAVPGRGGPPLPRRLAQALRSPRVAPPAASTLRSATNQADYLLIAPRAFLAAAEPLVARRQDQGLSARAVAFEEIVDEFGHGQPSAEAIQGFLAFAFQSWARPSPRYVLLLGDSSYDPRNFTGTSFPSPLPALWTKTSYLWTASDPQLAAVNGEDELPDLAIGRLPATSVEQAQSARRQADRVGGLGPGALGPGRARGRQPGPGRRLRGQRRRHCAELPRGKERGAAAA